jgi:hypothetical protein
MHIETALLMMPLALPLAVSLLAVWAALGRAHWFLRFVVNCVIPALFTLGYPRVLALVVPLAAFIIGPLALCQLVNSRRGQGLIRGLLSVPRSMMSARFSIEWLLLLVAAVGMIVGIAIRIPASQWDTWTNNQYPNGQLCIAACYAALTLLVVWQTAGRLQWISKAILISTCWLFSGWMLAHLSSPVTWRFWVRGRNYWPFWVLRSELPEIGIVPFWLLLLGFHGALLGAILLLLRRGGFGNSSSGSHSRTWSRRAARLALVIITALVAFPLASTFYVLWEQRTN